jgi:hypothetical protein
MESGSTSRAATPTQADSGVAAREQARG